MVEKLESRTDARVALLSLRNIENHVSRSHGYEFEDTILEMDQADLIAPEAIQSQRIVTGIKNRLSYRSQAARYLPTGLKQVKLGQDYDLFFYSIAHLRDLNALDAVRSWRERSASAICWIQELWIAHLDQHAALLDRLNEFDFVICSFAGTAEALKGRLKVPVHAIPWGLDAVHFCPWPNPPERAIEALGIGVRHPNTHAALIEHADRTGSYYSYETISGRAEMTDYRAHRKNYVGQLQRSRYFFSYIAKIERPEERALQTEFGLRYIEGMAAGAVILGSKIDSDAFREHLDWEDSVIDVPYDCAEIDKVIESLNSDPERLAAISQRNVVTCIKRHDHLDRWRRVLELAGLEATPQMSARQIKLDELEALAQGVSTSIAAS